MSAAYRGHTAGEAEVKDDRTGLKVDHVTGMKEWKDPSEPLRDRIAARVAAHVKHVECPSCVDVGCSIGNDCARLLAALDRPANVTGVDLMAAQLDQARTRVPQASFVEADAAKLPFGDNSLDSLQCARLLIHASDLEAVLDEFIRVLKPGGIGVFYESDYRTQTMLTSDPQVAKVYAAKQEMTASGLAQPNVAHAVLKYLLASPAIEAGVTFDGWAAVHRDPTYGWAGMLEMEKAQLAKLVEEGSLTQVEVDDYYANLDSAVARGDWVESGMLFEIGFVKKR